MDERRVLTVFVALFACIGSSFALCESTEATTGFLFSCELTRDEFFEDAAINTEVEFSAALRGYAGLPRWLSIVQASTLSPAYIYGSPRPEDVASITLEVRAMRRDTFVTDTREMVITVNTPDGSILQETEFYILNYNIEEFLSPEILERFGSVLEQVFQNPGAGITEIVHPATRGIPLQSPTAKHGVIVQTTPGLNVATITMATEQEANTVQGDCANPEDLSTPPQNFQQFSTAEFDIDWCQYQSHQVVDSTTDAVGGEEGTESIPVDRPSANGSSVSLTVIAVVCAAVLVFIIAALACIFFGGRRRVFYISRKKSTKKVMAVKHANAVSSGPSAAQQHLRDLALAPRRRSAGTNQLEPSDRAVLVEEDVSELEEELLEFQDVTDFHSRAIPGGLNRLKDPPPYKLPGHLSRQPLSFHQL